MPLRLVKEGEGPSPDEFRIPASDVKGHSARLWFRAIPTMARQIEQVVQSRCFPYRTKGDLLRHALHRHMNWLAKFEGVTSIAGQVDVILEVMRDEETNNDFKLVFARMDERISQHVTGGAQAEAIRLILTVNNHISAMPDGFWKTKYKEELKNKYGKLLENGIKAKLGEME